MLGGNNGIYHLLVGNRLKRKNQMTRKKTILFSVVLIYILVPSQKALPHSRIGSGQAGLLNVVADATRSRVTNTTTERRHVEDLRPSFIPNRTE